MSTELQECSLHFAHKLFTVVTIFLLFCIQFVILICRFFYSLNKKEYILVYNLCDIIFRYSLLNGVYVK